MMNPYLSVIVPVYNVEEYLAQCIESILSQTFADFELLLINDGSTDDSLKICEEYAKKDDRIKVFDQHNAGVSAARNTGIENATGSYITFVDSDDWLEPEMYGGMHQPIQTHAHPEVIMCDFNNRRENSKDPVSSHLRKGYYTKPQIVEEIYPTLLVTEEFGRIPIVSVCNCWFHRSLFVDHNIKFDEDLKFSEDYLFMAEIMLHAQTYYYLKGNYFYNYRQYEESRSKKYEQDWWENLRCLNRKLTELLCANPEYDFKRQLKLQLLHSAQFMLSGIAKTETLDNQQKVQEIRSILDHTELRAAFQHIKFKKQRYALSVVLFLLRYRLAFPYLLFHKALKYLKNA